MSTAAVIETPSGFNKPIKLPIFYQRPSDSRNGFRSDQFTRWHFLAPLQQAGVAFFFDASKKNSYVCFLLLSMQRMHKGMATYHRKDTTGSYRYQLSNNFDILCPSWFGAFVSFRWAEQEREHRIRQQDMRAKRKPKVSCVHFSNINYYFYC